MGNHSGPDPNLTVDEGNIKRNHTRDNSTQTVSVWDVSFCERDPSGTVSPMIGDGATTIRVEARAGRGVRLAHSSENDDDASPVSPSLPVDREPPPPGG